MKKIAKVKASTEFGKLSVKAGIDKNPKPTAADRIAGAKMKAAGKAKYGSKIKKAQTGLVEGYDLPEAVVTASRITDKPSKVKSSGGGSGRVYKPKPAKRSVHSVKTFRQKGSGPGSGLTKLKQRITRRYKDGGEVEMAKKGASVKKAMGKCKMGC